MGCSDRSDEDVQRDNEKASAESLKRAADRIMEQFTRCGSNALDSAAMHCLLPSAMLR